MNHKSSPHLSLYRLRKERQEVKEISFKIKGKKDISFKIEGGRNSFKEIALKIEGGKENEVIRSWVIYEKNTSDIK
jgi:hypothetical protein